MPDPEPDERLTWDNLSPDVRHELVDMAQARAEGRVDRRSLMQAGGLLGLGGLIGGGAHAATGVAGAAASTSDGEGDVGSPSTPVDAFLSGLAYDAVDISSATTVANHVVRYDCSISGFTITLGTELEGPSGFAQPVILIDETGNAGTNAVTVDTESGNGIDSGTSIQINHDNAITCLWFDSSEWRSTRFIDTVDARVGNIEDLNIGSADLLSSGDLAFIGPSHSINTTSSTTSTSYVSVGNNFQTLWDDWSPTDAQTTVYSVWNGSTQTGDRRLQNLTDGETVHEATNTRGDSAGPTNYIPTTTGSRVSFEFQHRSDDGDSMDTSGVSISMGVQV